MGMVRRMKDMKDMASAAPETTSQAQQPGAQAQQMAAPAQQMPGFRGAGALGGLDFDPIAGVTLGQFAAVSKGIAAYNYDQSKLAEIAASKGIDPVSWETASRAWHDRVKASPAVAQRFNELYRQS
jgi:hypothetical protein